MLEFEQWLEVEKVTHYPHKPINEVLKDCWEYSAKKTKEDVEQSVIDNYEEQITDLENENNSLASENDELTCECEDMENKFNRCFKLLKRLSNSAESGDSDFYDTLNDIEQFIKENE